MPDPLTLSFQGRAAFLGEEEAGPGIIVGVRCIIGSESPDGDPFEVIALLDTATHWGVMLASLAQEIGIDTDPRETPMRLRTKDGTIAGRLDNVTIRLSHHAGRPIEWTTTFLVTDAWSGPLMLGWNGCLACIRIAVDPGDGMIYFGECSRFA